MTSGTPQITLYNTLTRTKEPFRPIDANNVRMYVCGPTVYDFAHIGNARPVIVFDVLFRLLRQVYGADHVTYVRNITDVDDKINARALRDYPDLPLNEAIRKVTEKTEAQFLSDAERLGNLPPTWQPRATDNIAEMQVLIGNLIQRGHAYEANGEVLFSVQSMPDYGQLSGRNLEDNLAGARIAVDAHKRNPADFVLWKQSSVEEPGWDSPWGRGRPGWHIECSAMSERYLWDEIRDKLSPEAHRHPHAFDIHGGGLDLIFPHHENEIAQSRCAHGTHAMANIWMHNGFLQVEGQKMSKSLGNFYTISQLLDSEDFGGRKWPGEVLRLAMLMTHYREPIDFSVARLEEADRMLRKWARVYVQSSDECYLADWAVEALADDLNISELWARLHSLARQAEQDASIGRDVTATLNALGFKGLFLKLSGAPGTTDGEDSAIEALVTARLAALNAKDFAKADAIRNELAEQGIALMDYKDENGERQTKWEVKR
ncbi:cysteine--tRNA ligase [Devosia sp.]|uniref:cysteine--tRNA ligase n=1 Tax=Devosia sp. TaxID=1871048 RepID=UPI0019F4C839|nr:cysteine--tRNA ligase [Devosia sp.]MBE0582112.1 cysteine--tRNA ligase [Devosia sp.]